MSETRYIDSIRRLLPPDIHAWKINANFARGVPDNWYSGTAADLWVEYKFYRQVPKTLDLLHSTKKTKPKLSRLQQLWLEMRHIEGRNVAVIVGTPFGGLILPGLDWLHAFTRAEFFDKAKPKAEVAEWISQFVTR